MRMKMARRMLKAKDTLPDRIIQYAKEMNDKTEALLQTRWTAIQNQVPPFGPLTLDLKKSVIQTLPNSRAYLDRVLQGRTKRAKPPFSIPANTTRLAGQLNFSVFAGGALTRSFDQHRHLALFDFEHAVHNHLSSWVHESLANHTPQSCSVLSSCLDQYMSAALASYTQDVADTSIMILTILELWVGLDQLVTSQFKILLDYSPEIPETLIQPLLLRSSLHLNRARTVQTYIRQRQKRATYGSSFSGKNDYSSLPVRYFQLSDNLQNLKQSIEQDAATKRNQKLRELEQLNATHARLRQAIPLMECAFITNKQGNTYHARRSCEKCKMQNRANSMKIAVCEWPLPSGEFEAQAVVFELRCPEVFNIWRSTTHKVLCDLAGAVRGGQATHFGTLADYDGLQPWVPTSKFRVTVATTSKSFRKSHYATTKIPSTAQAVCVNNGLNFKLYDSTQSTWATGPLSNASCSKYGTFILPSSSPYHYLQYTLEGTSHTSNQVIANQYDCPKDISLHEHYAFGTLRSGPRLQWMNIVRGLEENLLTFSREEVYTLHTQAAWQLGPLSEDAKNREWHIELNDPEFGQLLVRQATRVLDRIRANWLESTTVHIIVMLVARLISSTTDTTTHENAIAFLRDARAVTFGWLKELSRKLQNTEVEALDFQQRICEMAFICRSTYDIDASRLPQLLNTPRDWVDLIACSIILHDNRPSNPDNASPRFKTLLARDRRLAYKALPILLSSLRNQPRILDSALTQYWNGYRPGLWGWSAPGGPSAQWVTTNTMAGGSGEWQQIHLNLLEGRLLLDGQPFGRLPPEYVSHPTYARLFGQKILDVVPSTLPGMVFTTRTAFYDFQISLSLDSAEHLVVRASQDGDTFELIPHSKFTDDFPTFFSSEYHHWMNIGTGVVEFRPLDKPWVSENDNWRLYYSSRSSSTMKMTTASGFVSLLDRHSAEFGKIAAQIAPLESANYLHIARSDTDHLDVTVELPRMKLTFFVNGKMELESQNFRGQVIDKTQSSGTMFGLKDQLVLCAKSATARSLPQSRSVIIPYGAVQFSLRGNHTQVAIDRGSERYVNFYRYKIDTDLGYLANTSTSLTSRLFKIYLHALTSHCLPDPLIRRTGTEEALYELGEAATTSFDQIDEEQAQLLQLIGSLTPKRVYYPAHLKAMQTTTWAGLPSLAQHYAYCTAVNSVLERAHTLELFNSLGFHTKPYEIKYDHDLLMRATYRTRIYYPSDSAGRLSAAPDNAKVSDIWYEGKDHLSQGWTESGQRASWVSWLVNRAWNMPFKTSLNLAAQFEKWHQVKGPDRDLQITYTQEWLGFSLPSCLLSIYNACQDGNSPEARYALSICLAAGIYGGWLTPEFVPSLVAFAGNPQVRCLSPPTHPEYRLPDKYGPSVQRIMAIVSSHCRPIDASPAAQIVKEKFEPKAKWRQRRKADYDANMSLLKPQLATHWTNCWPGGVSAPSDIYYSWFNVNGCIEQIQAYFDSCLRNQELRSYLRDIEKALSSAPITLTAVHSNMPRALQKPQIRSPQSMSCANLLSFDELVKSRAPCTLYDFSTIQPSVSIFSTPGHITDTKRLKGLLDELHEDRFQPLRRRYSSDLETSRVELVQTKSQEVLNQLPPLTDLKQNRGLARESLDSNYEIIVRWLGPRTELENVIAKCGIWPRLAPRLILGKLSLQARKSISVRYQTEISKYARSFIEYQRAQRLISLALEEKHEEFYKELKLANVGSEKEANNPDWLLVQIDGNFSARSVQAQVAREMITPSSCANTVLQLNMGEGKSSVIVPIVAAALADTTQLVRVVVLKPLWRQMFQLLVSRLSGLVNRRIYYLPFGRHIRVGESQAKQIQDLYAECMREGGILLVQPEHILSFQLMGVDQLLSASTQKELATSSKLREMDAWLFKNARDVLDESDEILHVRYQLVYTVGEQQSLEEKLKHEARVGGQFPFVRIMPESEEVITELTSAVAKDAIAGLLPNLNFGILSKARRKMALRLLTRHDISVADARQLKKLDLTMRGGLLLLRGLLVYGIVAFALRDKHYRVDYGLHLSRCLLAVPYHAKDTPSPRAEFGHPEVAIILTCLSYYNGGLTESQLETCFEILFKLDNPDLEYEQWVRRNEETPPNLSQLNGVNLKDREQFVNQLIPTFSCNAAVIDFFLSSVVFPKEAKQFPHKLSTSGWDLADVKTHVTTGFSGTNDNRYLLPASIRQSDPLKQSSTNALVLTYLLRPENNHYLCTRGNGGETYTATRFMDTLVKQSPEIRVLLDVGAQMLEFTNEELVKYWLKLRPDIAAGVYFNDMDELVILPRNGTPVAFHSSPFSQQMDKCIVYLDDGHTRGTDLALPKGTRAAVTLGPKVTKDRLLQGCMRMRKLGFGQSVMFFAPPEIDSQIRKVGGLASWNAVDALDVLRWAMIETCKDLEHHTSHWVQQGVEHYRRAEALRAFAATASTDALKGGWMMPEARSLEAMYGASVSDAEFTNKAFSIPALRRQLVELGIQRLHDPGMDEEQERERESEREVSHEAERQQQVERPAKLHPVSHSVRQELRWFIQHGYWRLQPSWAVPLFQSLTGSWGIPPGTWSTKLLASTDFCTTLTTSSLTKSGDYMRPLNWVLSGNDGVLIALSPYEANEMLPAVRQSTRVRLHVFAPRVAQSMLSFSDLQFYSPPPLVNTISSPPETLIQLQLSLFAGQLYFDSHSQYRTLCGFLGVYMGIDVDEEADDIQVQSDGFITKTDRQKLVAYAAEYKACGFEESPVAALKDLIGYRRKGMEFLRTHVGQILHARQLKPSDFLVVEPTPEANSGSLTDSLGCVIA
ncbi:kinase-like protein [Ceratobasidium sp. AG-Ba]|nr:kinase-like protein [Ceratobasidium sp. AG-Ba]